MTTPLITPGMKFNRLTVIGRNYEPREKSQEAYWDCVCECGGTSVVRTASLTSGKTKSCGCLQKEVTSQTNSTHGMSKTSEYSIWHQMIRRCHDVSNDAYSRYGGRGIEVCDRWKNSFENFYADMGARPSPAHSLDRERNEEGYHPGNCRWATDTEQANNRRTNHIVEVGGEKKTLAQALVNCEIDYKIVHQRMAREGMTIEEAMTKPLRQHATYEHNGESLNILQWSKKTGISDATIRYRLKNGMSISEALTTPVKKPA